MSMISLGSMIKYEVVHNPNIFSKSNQNGSPLRQSGRVDKIIRHSTFRARL